MKSTKLKAMVNRIIRKHGAIIDLRANPEVLLDVLRELSSDLAGGNPCGGTPPSPAPPPSPGPTKAGRPVTNDDLMRAVLRVARDVAAIQVSVKTLARKK